MSMQPQLLVDRRVIAHGQSKDITFGEGTPHGIIDWSDPNGIGAPLNLSIFSQLRGEIPPGLLLPEVAALGDQVAAELQAEIQWGDGGTQSVVFCDVDRSTSIGFTGSWIRVIVKYLGIGGIPDPPPITVSCHISEATIGGGNPPARLTSRVGALAAAPGPGNKVVVAVPPFAFEVRPLAPFPPGPGRVEIEQLNAVGVVLQRTEYGDTEQFQRELLHNATRAVRLSNEYPAPLPLAALLWGLAL